MTRGLTALFALWTASVVYGQSFVNKLTVDEAIHLALSRNKSIKVADFDRGIAKANWWAAVGTFDPVLKFSRSHSENELPVSFNPVVSQLEKSDSYSASIDGLMPWGLNYSLGGVASNGRGTDNNFSNSFVSFGGVTLTQPLLKGFGFGANLSGVRLAKADRKISQWEFRQMVIDTMTNVIFAYGNLIQSQDDLRIAIRSRDLAATLVSDNQKRVALGGLDESSVTTAKAQAASREETIIQSRQTVKESENALRNLLGEEQFPQNALPLEVERPNVDTFEIDPQNDLQKAFQLRSDYQVSRLGLVKNGVTLAAARNALLPQVNLVGSYGYNGLDQSFAASRRQVAERDDRSYSAGFVVSIPLSFTESRGKYRAAHLQLEQAEMDLKKLKADIAVAVANAIGQISATKERVEANRTAFDLAEKALKAELKKFEAGTSTTLNVLQQQQNLTLAESRLSSALADQYRAAASYDQVVGTTLTRYRISLSDE